MSDSEWLSFRQRVSGKWVLAGEHAVLRGATAVALPHPEFGLELSFEPGSEGLRVAPAEAQSTIHDLLAAVQDDRERDGYTFRAPSGLLHIQSTIPIGAGLGSSAALCVALSRWLAPVLSLDSPEKIQEFATRLEHRFHGRSSGMDVAVISAAQPISFSMERGARALGIRKTPKFTFHDTNLRARTSECVLRVEKFREERPMLAMQVDEAMSKASREAMEGLMRYDAGETSGGLSLVAEAMKLAQECFYSWELVPGAANRLQEDLLEQGALAVKITGAGGGGMLVALWPDHPAKSQMRRP